MTASEGISRQGIQDLVKRLTHETDRIAVCIQHLSIRIDENNRCIEHVKVFADVNAKLGKKMTGAGIADTVGNRTIGRVG